MIMYAVPRAVLLIVVPLSRGAVTQDVEVTIFLKNPAVTRPFGRRFFVVGPPKSAAPPARPRRAIGNSIMAVVLGSDDLGGSKVY